VQQYGKGLDKVKRGVQEMSVMDVKVYVDLETTGVDSERYQIIEIGAVVFVGGKETAEFCELVNPGEAALIAADPRALDVNKIDLALVRVARPTAAVAASFRTFLEAHRGTLHAFPVEFESSFLRKAPWLISTWGDCVMRAARDMMASEDALPMINGSPKRPRLGEAAAFFGVTGCGPAHRSLSDARKAGRIHQELISRQMVEDEARMMDGTSS
jgi:DNA polymerase III epsilon subunit-like protein